MTYRRFPSVCVFKPDLEALIDTLQQEEPSSITIYDSDYEYASLTELFEQYSGREIRTLNIAAHFSEIVMITLSGNEISVFASETTPKVLAVLIRLSQFFKVHQRQSTSIIFHPFFYPLAVAALVFVVGTAGFTTAGNRAVSIIVVGCIAVWVFFRNRVGGFSRILSINRYEQDSFWSRNRELGVAIISSIVSAGLAFFVAYLLFKGGIK